MKRKPKTSRKKLELSLDIAWSLKVRSKGFCAVCGPHIKHEVLHAHHIFSRKHKGTRWDLQNGVALCPRHHLFFFHRDIYEASLWLQDNYDKAILDRIRIKAMGVSKWHESDLQILLDDLQLQSV